MKIPISQKPYNGTCEVCGDAAELRDSRSTALLQSQDTQELSAIQCNLVRCFSGDHAYFVLNWDSQIVDPFPEGWEPEPDGPLDFRLPPPPPMKEDH